MCALKISIVVCRTSDGIFPTARWAFEIAQEGRDGSELFVSFLCYELATTSVTKRESEPTLQCAQAFGLLVKETYFQAKDPEVPVSILGATRFSEK
jgi:hypothetical protein